MLMCNLINKILCLVVFQFVILLGGSNTKIIKNYTISKNFGTETRELSQSTVVRYNSKRQLLDSTLYIHNIPLSKKYSYIDFKDRQSLQKLEGVERLMHFKYEYNLKGDMVSSNYMVLKMTLKWKEFYNIIVMGNYGKL